jgi:hypothetical protein
MYVNCFISLQLQSGKRKTQLRNATSSLDFTCGFRQESRGLLGQVAAPGTITTLKIHSLPSTGGDTLLASGYDIYDKLLPAWTTLADNLNATFTGPRMREISRCRVVQLFHGPRGLPEKIGSFQGVYLVCRFGIHYLMVGRANCPFLPRVQVTKYESDLMLAYFRDFVVVTQETETLDLGKTRHVFTKNKLPWVVNPEGVNTKRVLYVEITHDIYNLLH